MPKLPVSKFSALLLRAGFGGLLGAIGGIAVGFLLAGPVVIAVTTSSSPSINPLWIELIAMECGAVVGFGAAALYVLAGPARTRRVAPS